MAGIRTKSVKSKSLATDPKMVSSGIKKTSQELKMRVRRDIDVGLGTKSPSSNVVLKSRTKSFGSLLQELEKQEAANTEEQKNTIISRGLMGEGEITFTVDSKKKRRGKKDENENQDAADGEEGGRKRNERESGRKKQRFEGRRSGKWNDHILLLSVELVANGSKRATMYSEDWDNYTSIQLSVTESTVASTVSGLSHL
ncbi:hypothetical protein POJ06DRAFT_303724 [Lipomyces tetrasporus]|uniref:Uncharacterized protein n=1 Tax=Lipomyces tetrasporus TaxID=54092 RepID=A0AAD7QPJ3_9ASCO|nr:uncharacterized protein POJ06DRAFT_303724 [Lipomyces tetrasporus]KAJ8097487.1 hypothetical protein POJ06DRAFT_303724 [Lipomyces tetrasporus]